MLIPKCPFNVNTLSYIFTIITGNDSSQKETLEKYRTHLAQL